MKLQFYKYQATGNDFILIDNRERKLSLSTEQIIKLCDRKFGIGADGLILLEPHDSLAFTMNYYNCDGTQSLCGNGSRAAVLFASSLGMITQSASFHAFDGAHEAELLPSGIIRIKMNDVKSVTRIVNGYFIDTGSPHVILFVDQVKNFPIVEEGRKIRYSETYRATGGTNVNFVERQAANTLFVRTYERGVENETLSCGTGVTAAALAAACEGFQSPVSIHAPGGELTVEFKKNMTGSLFTDIYLVGPAKMVFQGELEL